MIVYVSIVRDRYRRSLYRKARRWVYLGLFSHKLGLFCHKVGLFCVVCRSLLMSFVASCWRGGAYIIAGWIILALELMCIHIYICTYTPRGHTLSHTTHIQTCAYECICMRIHVMYAHIHYKHMHIYIYIWHSHIMHTHAYVHTYTHVTYTKMSMITHIRARARAHTHTHTHTHTHRYWS